MMIRFHVVIPTYNNADTIERAVGSVLKQTYKNYRLTVVEDDSEDGTRDIVKEMKGIDSKIFTHRRLNGGARNVGVGEYAEMFANDLDYLLFLDGDDEFRSPEMFDDLARFIEKKELPDMVRLPYHVEIGGVESPRSLKDGDGSIDGVAQSTKVACWTKCVKLKLFQKFPENTLMEDVVQHLKQCDVCESVATFDKVCVIWHRREESTSNLNSDKWKSSAWRFVADLMDLELKKESTRSRRDAKVRLAKEALFNGRFIQ